MKLIFIADFFADEINGGGELNNEEFISLLGRSKYFYKEILKVKSSDVTLSLLEENKESNYIIANFIGLSETNKKFIEENCHYIIYEHDHKYLNNRNPAAFKNFEAPKEAIINYGFYKNAKAVLCQSKFHSNIVKNNLGLENIINLGGNLWDTTSLDKMKEYATKDKKEVCSIMNSPISHKNTSGAIDYCTVQKLSYELIDPCSYYDFLNKISNNDTLVFFPQTPETLSRVVVEARMMNMRTVTNSLIGATSENWFEMKGIPLINFFETKKSEILRTVGDLLK